MILYGKVVTESATSTTEKVVQRFFDIWFNFKDEIPVGSREHGSPAEYESTLHIRYLASFDDGRETFLYNAYDEIARINGEDIMIPLQ